MSLAKKTLVILTSAGLMLSLGAIPAIAACEGVISGDNVNLRNESSTSSEVVVRLSKGKSVTVKSEKNGWYKVSVDGNTGYIRSDMLDLGTSGSKLYVAKTDINLRESANTDCGVVTTLALGQSVQVKGVSGDWYKVSTDGATGYIRSDLLSKSKPQDAAKVPTQETAPASTTSGSAASTALSTEDVNADYGFDTTEDIFELLEEEGIPAAELDAATALSNKELQEALKQLGFYSGEVEGNFGSVSQAALMSFQRAYDLEVDGKAGPASAAAVQEALASGGNGSSAGRIKVSSNGVILAEWFNYMKAVFPKYEALRCVDVQTGREFRLRAFSCGNHADVEPPTKEDTDILYEINGNKWSWDPRPIWVYIDGQCYAAVINVQPHGPDTLPDNGMNGQICMHFVHSRNHNTGKENNNMQAGILEAFAQAENAPPATASDYLVPPDMAQE